jgi:hypothetical protein
MRCVELDLVIAGFLFPIHENRHLLAEGVENRECYVRAIGQAVADPGRCVAQNNFERKPLKVSDQA